MNESRLLSRFSGGLVLISHDALTEAPLGSKPYHALNRPNVVNGVMLTLCGCYGIVWPRRNGVADPLITVAPKVAELIGRPCKACVNIATTGKYHRRWHHSDEAKARIKAKLRVHYGAMSAEERSRVYGRSGDEHYTSYRRPRRAPSLPTSLPAEPPDGGSA